MLIQHAKFVLKIIYLDNGKFVSVYELQAIICIQLSHYMFIIYFIVSFCWFFTVDFKSLFSKEALYRKIKEQGKSVIKQVTSQLIDEFLKLLKIAKVKIYFYIITYN